MKAGRPGPKKSPSLKQSTRAALVLRMVHGFGNIDIFGAGGPRQHGHPGLSATQARTAPAVISDPVLKAMGDELDRSIAELKLNDLDKPYFIQYVVYDDEDFTASATFGALSRSSQTTSGWFIPRCVSEATTSITPDLPVLVEAERPAAFWHRRPWMTTTMRFDIRSGWRQTPHTNPPSKPSLRNGHIRRIERTQDDPVPDFSKEKADNYDSRKNENAAGPYES